MTELDVTLTDFLLMAECVALVVLVSRQPSENPPARRALTALFSSLAVTSAVGGVTHGFFNTPGQMQDLLWLLTMTSLGFAACSAWAFFGYGTFSPPVAWVIAIAAILSQVIYLLIVFLVSRDFTVAVINYLPASIALAAMFLKHALRSRVAAPWHGLAGMLLTFLAAGIQQAEIGLHPRYLNYNALYHLVQAAGFFLIYRGGVWVIRRGLAHEFAR